MTQDDMVQKLLTHDSSLDKVADSIDRLVATSNNTNGKLDDLVKSMGKQEVILEKISNMEDKYKGSTNRIHKRIDDIEELVKTSIKHRESRGCPVGRETSTQVSYLVKDIDALKDDKKWFTRVIIGKLIIMGMIVIYTASKG